VLPRHPEIKKKNIKYSSKTGGSSFPSLWVAKMYVVGFTVNVVFSVTFRVSDSGGGIDHEMLERIWEYGCTRPGVTEKWSDHNIFEQIRSSKAADSFSG